MTITVQGGSYFADNAIVVTVTTSGFPTGTSLALVRLYAGGYEMTAEVKADQADSVKFDISSVARAMLAGTEPSAGSLTCQAVTISLNGREEYMKNGEYITGQTQSGGSIQAVIGGYSWEDLQGRSESGAAGAPASCPMTKKPARGAGRAEVIKSGDSMLISTAGCPPTTTATVITQAGQVGQSGVWAYPSQDRDLVGFRFLNRYGVIENATARTKEALSVETEGEEMTLAHEPQYVYGAGAMMVKGRPRKVWVMSSGPVDREWAVWWAEEFVGADRHWMRTAAGSYLPVIIEAGDVKAYDRIEGNLASVEFTVKAAI